MLPQQQQAVTQEPVLAMQARDAQIELSSLEKNNAPVEKQLVQAALFAGVSIGSPTPTDSVPRRSAYHGRQEWVLRWILKKLSGDAASRAASEAWILLSKLVEELPVRTAAKTLSEKKFPDILKQVIDELNTCGTAATVESPSKSGSKKRKRSDAVESIPERSPDSILASVKAIYAAVYSITRTHIRSHDDHLGAEYMKFVLKTSTADAGHILGGWLSVINKVNRGGYLEPFVKIWSLRAFDADELSIFARECLKPLSGLLCPEHDAESDRPELERLLAKNVVIPAKAAFVESGNPDLLKSSISDVIQQNIEQATTVMDIAIRCIPQKENRRRRPQDTEWLRAVFQTLLDIVEESSSPTKEQVATQLLRLCLHHTVDLELDTLRGITRRIACEEERVQWDMIAIILKLDANTFLIPSDQEDLLLILYNHISQVDFFDPSSAASEIVVDTVLVPLMEAFAKARKLSEFVLKWHSSLSVSEKSGGKQSTLRNGAWEDSRLQTAFAKAVEANLDTKQILSLVGFLGDNLENQPGSSLLIGAAMATAISQEDKIDSINLSLWELSSKSGLLATPESPYARYAWSIAESTFSWQTPLSRSEAWLAAQSKTLLLAEGVLERHKNAHPDYSKGLLGLFKCLCVLWIKSGDVSEVDATWQLLLQFVPQLSYLFFHFHITLLSVEDTNTSVRMSLQAPNDVESLRLAALAYANCIIQEYPAALRLFTAQSPSKRLPNSAVKFSSKEINKDYKLDTLPLWFASATAISASRDSSDARKGAFPSSWKPVLDNEIIQSSAEVLDIIIETLLHKELNSSHSGSAFAISTLLDVPVDAFSRRQREKLIESLSVTPENELLNPAALSLNMRMMQKPTLYEGIAFKHLLDFAARISDAPESSTSLLPIVDEYAKLVLRHVAATINQSRSRVYLEEMLVTLSSWLESSQKKLSPSQFSSIGLADIALKALVDSEAVIVAMGLTSVAHLEELTAKFKDVLVGNLRMRLEKPKKLKSDLDPINKSVYAIIKALRSRSLSSSEISSLSPDLRNSIASVEKVNHGLAFTLNEFFVETDPDQFKDIALDILLSGTISTGSGRQAATKTLKASIANMCESEVLALVYNLIEEGLADTSKLNILFSAGKALRACTDSREVVFDRDGLQLNLASVYSLLANKLPDSGGFRQFCMISELMELMLRTKGRVISQHNIDCTLGGITTLCSPRAPVLPLKRSSTIFLHLCHLLQTVIISHRLKLQGHFHLVVQVIQSLLRCLFTPISSSYAKELLPSWAIGRTLSLSHAEAFTRLLTLLCDPSSSSVSQSSATSLNSATAKARRLVAQHIPVVLTSYIKLQLDMGLVMVPEVRNALVPGVWALFDTMSVDGRRVLGESLDASGRRILSDMIRDWTKFGKWTGS